MLNAYSPTHARRAPAAIATLSLCLLSALGIAHAQVAVHQHVHQHGVAKLDVAVELRQISLHLDSPLDNLIGFERAPRNSAERKLVTDTLARLRSPELFAIDPAAQCKLVSVELNSAALKLGQAPAEEQEAGHADLDADYSFSCANAPQAAWIDVGLFNFPHMQKLEVQLATPAGQFRRDLARPTQRLSLKK
jgi:Protein of unknown function (DUF2796)